MKYRHVVLQDQIDISTAATTTYDFKISDIVSRIGFKFNIQNHGTTPVIIAHPARAVTKIELIDGSTILESVSAEELLAMNYYDKKGMPDSYINGITASQSYFAATLDFGRWLWDTQLALNPNRLKTPQLRVTYNKALYESSSTYMYMTIWADVFDEKSVTPSGFIKRHEIATWTPANAAESTVKVPRDYPIRAMFATGYSTTLDVAGQIAKIKLSEHANKKVPIDCSIRRYLAQIQGDYPKIHENVDHLGATAGEVLYTMASYDPEYTGNSTGNEVVYAPTYVADTLTVKAATGANRVNGFAIGHIPFHTIPFYFGDRDDPSDWYDLSNIKDLEFKATGAAAVGTSPVGRLCLEQLLPI